MIIKPIMPGSNISIIVRIHLETQPSLISDLFTDSAFKSGSKVSVSVAWTTLSASSVLELIRCYCIFRELNSKRNIAFKRMTILSNNFPMNSIIIHLIDHFLTFPLIGVPLIKPAQKVVWRPIAIKQGKRTC